MPTADSSNLLVRYAIAQGRDHITPEDVTHILETYEHTSLETVIDFLEILGKQTKIGIEDAGLCAFILWKELT